VAVAVKWVKGFSAVFSLLLASGLSLISGDAKAVSAAEVACKTEVGSWSSREKMANGDFSANVFARDFLLTATSIGFGSTAWRTDETTIVDGTVYRAHPDAHHVPVMMSQQPEPDSGFVMLQLASPSTWRRQLEPLPAITSFDDLNFELDDIAETLQCGDNVLLPFKLIGHANSLTWRLDTRPDKLKTDSENVDVIIVGIYNRNQRRQYFMSEGYNLHAHVLLPREKMAGHVENIDLAEGAKLFLPVKQ
jgi:hypothetical protein